MRLPHPFEPSQTAMTVSYVVLKSHVVAVYVPLHDGMIEYHTSFIWPPQLPVGSGPVPAPMFVPGVITPSEIAVAVEQKSLPSGGRQVIESVKFPTAPKNPPIEM